MPENRKHPKYTFFDGLVREFNNQLALPARRELYDQLKDLGMLGKVFSENAQALLRFYLFDMENCRYWPERTPFESHNNDHVEERRVHEFLDSVMNSRRQVDPSEDYETIREVKAKQLYLLLREMNYRIYLAKRAEDRQGTSLGLLPCTWRSLRKIRKTYRNVLVIEELWAVTKADLKAKGLSAVTAGRIVMAVRALVQKKRRRIVTPTVAKRLEAAEAAGQAAFF